MVSLGNRSNFQYLLAVHGAYLQFLGILFAILVYSGTRHTHSAEMHADKIPRNLKSKLNYKILINKQNNIIIQKTQRSIKIRSSLVYF